MASVNLPNICIRCRRAAAARWDADNKNFQSNSIVNDKFVRFISFSQSSGHSITLSSHYRFTVDSCQHQRNWISPKNNRTQKPKINSSSKFTNICEPIKFTWMDALMRNGENRMRKKPRNSAWMCELYRLAIRSMVYRYIWTADDWNCVDVRKM